MNYFDHNATTSIDEKVWVAMLPYLREYYGNPSSLHHHGRITRTAIDTARQQVAHLVNARPEQVVFTSSGTEANNLALQGYMHRHLRGCLGVSAIEHSSILEQCSFFQSQGWDSRILPVDSLGLLKMEALQDFLKHKPQLVSVMAANNETGILQDEGCIATLFDECECVLHTDATQAAGKTELSFRDGPAQLMTLSSHKLYGPKGAGALIVDRAIELCPVLHGGMHESGLRSGTENVAAIVGFGMAAELAQVRLRDDAERIRHLRDTFEARLRAALPDTVIFSEHAPRLPNTSCFSLPGLHGEAVVMQLDQQGFSVSSGSACHSDVAQPSHVLKAMGVADEVALGAIRVSIGRENTANDLARLEQAIVRLVAAGRQHDALMSW